ncbi:MBL fold metallo-hydrolase [Marinomonas transparens]|uniref:MBL fold metallo-hydrolase n=1 Tax=Marinomonas transparens TaxID=2795388 RepID=A0A934MVZ3_9GAMM|nr:MBL fold metallo-hydrolase [Marinomonas transparens]MBJ7537594.1 MBL fold metallo-hydrolase [Marinomonas transparens]
MKKLSLSIISLLLFLSAGCSLFTSTSDNQKTAGNIAGLSVEEIDKRLSELPPFLTMGDLFNTTVLEPTQLFDNVYFVGYVSVGSFIIKTTDGLILIDAMWTPNDAEAVIIPGMKALGLNPADIKYVVITHGHADHYGAAKYLEEKYAAKILISKADWDFIHSPDAPVLTDPFGNYSTEIPLPNSYIEVKDGQQIQLGNTSITALLTPGHTPGSVSLVIPVTDNGVAHNVALWGGTGLPGTRKSNEAYLESLNRFEEVANIGGVDANISTHPFAHNLISQMEALKKRQPNEANPIITGNAAFREYVDSVLRKNVTDKLATF